MVKIVDRLTNQLGGKKDQAIAILKKQGTLDASGKLTEKGKKRNAMSPGARAKDRAAKYSKKHKVKDYKYNSKTNMATLKDKK